MYKMSYKHHKENSCQNQDLYILIVLIYIIELPQLLLIETVAKYFYQSTIKDLQRKMNNG